MLEQQNEQIIQYVAQWLSLSDLGRLAMTSEKLNKDVHNALPHVLQNHSSSHIQHYLLQQLFAASHAVRFESKLPSTQCLPSNTATNLADEPSLSDLKFEALKLIVLPQYQANELKEEQLKQLKDTHVRLLEATDVNAKLIAISMMACYSQATGNQAALLELSASYPLLDQNYAQGDTLVNAGRFSVLSNAQIIDDLKTKLYTSNPLHSVDIICNLIRYTPHLTAQTFIEIIELWMERSLTLLPVDGFNDEELSSSEECSLADDLNGYHDALLKMMKTYQRYYQLKGAQAVRLYIRIYQFFHLSEPKNAADKVAGLLPETYPKACHRIYAKGVASNECVKTAARQFQQELASYNISVITVDVIEGLMQAPSLDENELITLIAFSWKDFKSEIKAQLLELFTDASLSPKFISGFFHCVSPMLSKKEYEASARNIEILLHTTDQEWHLGWLQYYLLDRPVLDLTNKSIDCVVQSFKAASDEDKHKLLNQYQPAQNGTHWLKNELVLALKNMLLTEHQLSFKLFSNNWNKLNKSDQDDIIKLADGCLKDESKTLVQNAMSFLKEMGDAFLKQEEPLRNHILNHRAALTAKLGDAARSYPILCGKKSKKERRILLSSSSPLLSDPFEKGSSALSSSSSFVSSTELLEGTSSIEDLVNKVFACAKPQ